MSEVYRERFEQTIAAIIVECSTKPRVETKDEQTTKSKSLHRKRPMEQ